MFFSTSFSGLEAARADLTVTGNNIANISSNGFKRSKVGFSDAFAASFAGNNKINPGAGVNGQTVSQLFNQGNIKSTDNMLDMAINGTGFFNVEKPDGSLAYTRAGEFRFNDDLNIVDKNGYPLHGFTPDYSSSPRGSISNTVGQLGITASGLLPESSLIPQVDPVTGLSSAPSFAVSGSATTSIGLGVNLNASVLAPSNLFVGGFDASSLPEQNTYNNSYSSLIYDSLGEEHILTTYFVKDDEDINTWQMFVALDNNDVTPTPSAEALTPLRLVFNEQGRFVAHDFDPTTATPPQPALAAATVDSPASVTSTASTAPAPSGTLTALAAGDLLINGVAVPATSADSNSTSDAAASAAAIQDAIDSLALPNLSSSIVAASTNLGTFTAGVPALFSNGNLVINGIEVSSLDGGSGTGIFDSSAVLVNALDSIDGLSAALNSNSEVVLTVSNAADGRNITLSTDGNISSGASLSQLSLLQAQTVVERGAVTLTSTDFNPITLTGNAPSNAGFSPGTHFAEVTQENSDLLSFTVNHTNGADPQTITIDMNTSTQYGDDFAVTAFSQNGFEIGRLTNLSLTEDGIISANFTNGRSSLLGQVALATFRNPQGLQHIGDSLWDASVNSGSANLLVPGDDSSGSENTVTVTPSSLEESNVQLTDELVNLIIAQRNFQSNAQSLEANNKLLEQLLNTL